MSLKKRKGKGREQKTGGKEERMPRIMISLHGSLDENRENQQRDSKNGTRPGDGPSHTREVKGTGKKSRFSGGDIPGWMRLEDSGS